MYRYIDICNHYFWIITGWFWTNLLIWHPICKQHFYKYYYKTNNDQQKQLKNGKSDLQLISEAGGGMLAKLDWLMGYVRSAVLLLTMLFFDIVYTINT